MLQFKKNLNNSSKSEPRRVVWPQSGWDAGSPSVLPVWCLYSCCKSACRTPSRPPPPEDTTENIKTPRLSETKVCVSVCVCVVYPVLVGETPDPSGHFHSEDEEQEEEELKDENKSHSRKKHGVLFSKTCWRRSVRVLYCVKVFQGFSRSQRISVWRLALLCTRQCLLSL